jgi:hypothetical protein
MRFTGDSAKAVVGPTPHRFRPRYALANLGHPFLFLQALLCHSSYGTQLGGSSYHAACRVPRTPRLITAKAWPFVRRGFPRLRSRPVDRTSCGHDADFDHASRSWHPAKASFGDLSGAQAQHEQHQRRAGVARECEERPTPGRRLPSRSWKLQPPARLLFPGPACGYRCRP